MGRPALRAATWEVGPEVAAPGARGLPAAPPVEEGAPAIRPRAPWAALPRVSLRRSPLARRIVAFNLVALALLVAGVLHLDPFRDGLVAQRERALVTEARLVAAAIEARLEAGRIPGAALALALEDMALPEGAELRLFDRDGVAVASVGGADRSPSEPVMPRGTPITDALDALRRAVLPAARSATRAPDEATALLSGAFSGEVRTEVRDGPGGAEFRVAAPIAPRGRVAGALVLASASGVIDDLARAEREGVLRLFTLAIVVAIGLGLALASTIAGPLSDLAHAAEAGRGGASARVRIPDLTGRRDEIGRLSAAVRGLVAALYDRLDAEERFAADVAHEIKNPLASLGSAVGALRAGRPEQRERLMGVIEHDLRRLDRLVSDISNASRLDSELVREAEAPFDLVALLSGLAEHLSLGARARGVTLVADLPEGPLVVPGLEARMAQVFVNLIDNAVSFCEPGGGVRLWARRRADRVLVVVEDTGPGIPDAALARVFERFYSERPEGQFGDNSGLGLAISKQIVEAHGGVIWAENIREGAPDASEPRGARLVVGLPS